MKIIIGLLLLSSLGFADVSPKRAYESLIRGREDIKSYRVWGRVKSKSSVSRKETLQGVELSLDGDRFKLVFTDWGTPIQVFVGIGDSIYAYDPKLGRLRSSSTEIQVFGAVFDRDRLYEFFLGIPDSLTQPDSSYVLNDTLVLVFPHGYHIYFDRKTGTILKFVELGGGEVYYYEFERRGGFLRPKRMEFPCFPSKFNILLDFEEINPILTEEQLTFTPFFPKAFIRKLTE